MRTLKLQSQLSVDGFIAGPNGEMDWMVWNWDDQLNQFVDDLTQTVDCIIMGKAFAKGFIPHWQKVAKNPEDAAYEFGRKMENTQKVVFSKGETDEKIDVSNWKNAELSHETLQTSVQALKNQDGGDIIVYGGSEFVSSLIKEGLIDTFHLFMNPTALGTGLPIFHQLEKRQDFSLESAQKFDCGIVVLTYLKK